MFYPKKITDKERATAQMIAASHQMYSALKACRFERMEKCAWKRQHILLIETLYAKAEYAPELLKSNGSRRICAIFFNRHAIYDHSYYER
jgi:hypothetical protein